MSAVGWMCGEQLAKRACHDDESRSFHCWADRGGDPAAGCLRERWLRVGIAPVSTPSATSQGAVPTAEQLAAALIAADDYDGEWTVNVPPDAESAIDGVVPENQQEMLPTIEFCGKASKESHSAADALRWQAFRQIDQSEENPIDMGAGDRVGHMIFVQEFLVAGDPAEVESTFNALRDGMRACQGKFPAGEEGPGNAEPMTIPDVGDDRYGVLTTMEEAGGGAYWLLHKLFGAPRPGLDHPAGG